MSKSEKSPKQLKSKRDVGVRRPGPGGFRPGSGRKKVKHKKVLHSFKLANTTVLALKRFAKARKANLTQSFERIVAEYVTILDKGNTVYTWGGEQLSLDTAPTIGE